MQRHLHRAAKPLASVGHSTRRFAKAHGRAAQALPFRRAGPRADDPGAQMPRAKSAATPLGIRIALSSVALRRALAPPLRRVIDRTAARRCFGKLQAKHQKRFTLR
jgi:hypothetical protein